MENTGDDKFSRTRQLLLSDYNIQCTDDVLSTIKSLVSREEMDCINRSVEAQSFSEIQAILRVSEEKLRSPILVSILQNNKIFLNVMKKQGSSLYPETHNIHRKIVENYPIHSSAVHKKKDQGQLNVGITGKVVTRFPPEPTGYLHIGHAKAVLLNNHYATENEGTLIIRFDDTNPSKEKEEFEKVILEDLHVLGIKKFVLSHTSDYFDKIIELGKSLIKQGKAYCDNTDKERIRTERDKGIESEKRNSTVEENLKIFEEMEKGSHREYCVRAKIDMKNNNKALRDPVMFRNSKVHHYRVGDRYKIYPTYDFACPVVDSLENVTHTLRTTEFHDRNSQYKWFIENLGLENLPRIIEFSRLNFENTVLSKRKLKYFVENKNLEWNDPRIPTIRGIKRRGLRMDVLAKYVLMQGVKQSFSTISWDKLWAINKRRIDSESPRFLCIKRKNCVRTRVLEHVTCSGTVPRFVKNEELGMKEVLYGSVILVDQEDALVLEEGDEFRLLHWSNAVLQKKVTDSGIVKELEITLTGGEPRDTKHKISWISLLGSVAINLIEYGNLTVGDSEDLDKIFNPHSKTTEECLAENAISEIKEETILQFERIGFFYTDKHFNFNLVPFTKQQKKH